MARDVGRLTIREAQVGHQRRRAEPRRVPHPVVQPRIRHLAAQALKRLPEGPADASLLSRLVADDVAPETSDVAKNLRTSRGVAARRVVRHRRVRLGAREQVRRDCRDLLLVLRRDDRGRRPARRTSLGRRSPEARHHRLRLHPARVTKPCLHPLGCQLAADTAEIRSALVKVLEPCRGVACVTAAPLEGRQSRIQAIGARQIPLTRVTAHASGLGPPDRQHPWRGGSGVERRERRRRSPPVNAPPRQP